ncbi:hypothetical protein AB5I41_16430 [Sphingomonas sp. MMS24-JH45]
MTKRPRLGDGLAQALATYSDELLGRGELDREARRQCRAALGEAIAIHQELVEFAWYNDQASSFAGALENLVSDHEVFARLKRRGAYASVSLREAAKAMERAVAVYRASGQQERVVLSRAAAAFNPARMRG